jgi:DNA-binding winged helix-turn-helix (wHTH) protein/Tfp pilus assembly protein PilF
MAAAGNQRPFRFGAWRVDPARGVLLGDAGEETRLEPRLMDLLVLFAGAGGRVLSKDEIVEAVWDGRAIGDDTLAAAVSRLRRALGESPARRYIETVPKRGYRSVIGAPNPTAVRPRQQHGPAEAVALAEQGRRALGSPLSLAQARIYFEEAVRQAPGFAPAHRGLAEALLARHFAGGGEGLLMAAKAAANAAVGLDAGDTEGWAILGLAVLLADRDFAAADAAFQRAIALDPASAPAHRRRAFAFATVGRFVDAEREARQAVALQPASLEARDELLQLLIAARRYRHAAAEAATVLAMAPESGEAWFRRGWALALAGDEAEGLAALLKGLELWGVDAAHLAELRDVASVGGLAAVAGAAADVFAQQQVLYARRTMDVAMLRATAGQADAALEALETAAARDDPVLLLIRWLPYFDPLRTDPRFEAFVRRLRLVA